MFGLLLCLIVPSSGTVLPIVEYAFIRSQCLQNQFEFDGNSKSLGYLSRAGGNSACLSSNGVPSGNKWSSSNSISLLQKQLGSHAFSIEFWIQPKINLTFSTASVFSIGKDGISSSSCRNNFMVSAYILKILRCGVSLTFP